MILWIVILPFLTTQSIILTGWTLKFNSKIDHVLKLVKSFPSLADSYLFILFFHCCGYLHSITSVTPGRKLNT